MKKYSASIGLAFLVLNLTNSIYGAEAVQVPVPKDGDRWEFKAETKSSSSSTTDRLNGNYEIVSAKGQLDVFQIVDGQKIGIGPDSTAFLKRMLGFAQDEQQFLKFPLAVGNKWTAEYSVQSPGARIARRRTAEFNVGDQAQTKTTAGNFQTLKILGSNHGGQVPQAWEYFYNADCKCIVKFFYDSAVGGVGGKVEIELTKFSSSGGEIVERLAGEIGTGEIGVRSITVALFSVLGHFFSSRKTFGADFYDLTICVLQAKRHGFFLIGTL